MSEHSNDIVDRPDIAEWMNDFRPDLNGAAALRQSDRAALLGPLAAAEIVALRGRCERLQAALVRIDEEGSGVSPECEDLAAIAREALDE